jgi:hypothetical protein
MLNSWGFCNILYEFTVHTCNWNQANNFGSGKLLPLHRLRLGKNTGGRGGGCAMRIKQPKYEHEMAWKIVHSWTELCSELVSLMATLYINMALD